MKLKFNVNFKSIYQIKAGECFIPERDWRYVEEDIGNAAHHIYMRVYVPNEASGNIYYADLSKGEIHTCYEEHKKDFNVVPLTDIALNCNFNF